MDLTPQKHRQSKRCCFNLSLLWDLWMPLYLFWISLWMSFWAFHSHIECGGYSWDPISLAIWLLQLLSDLKAWLVSQMFWTIRYTYSQPELNVNPFFVVESSNIKCSMPIYNCVNYVLNRCSPNEWHRHSTNLFAGHKRQCPTGFPKRGGNLWTTRSKCHQYYSDRCWHQSQRRAFHLWAPI